MRRGEAGAGNVNGSAATDDCASFKSQLEHTNDPRTHEAAPPFVLLLTTYFLQFFVVSEGGRDS